MDKDCEPSAGELIGKSPPAIVPLAKFDYQLVRLLRTISDFLSAVKFETTVVMKRHHTGERALNAGRTKKPGTRPRPVTDGPRDFLARYAIV